MKNNIKILLVLLVTAILGTNAQQDPLFTQYMYNMSIINPAYTKSDVGSVNTGLIHRRQWVGLPEVGPVTTSAFVHTALSDKIEVGLNYVNDNIDDVFKTNDINADFAYKLNFDNDKVLSFGLKAGASFFTEDYTNVTTRDAGDAAFDNASSTFFNVGAGVYFNTEKYYIGLSTPNFIKSEGDNFENATESKTEEIHGYLTGGYVFDINQNIKFKPAFMTRVVKGAPLSFDITGNVLFNDRFEVGVAYRLDDAVSALINFRVIDNLRLGYAFDYTISDIEFSNTSGSHEFLLLYDFNILGKKYDKSPRFF